MQITTNDGVLTRTPADIFVLLSWACDLYATCLRSFHFTPSKYPSLSSRQLNYPTQTKPTMLKSAPVCTRRALRSAPKGLPTLMASLAAQAESSATPLVQISLLSTAVNIILCLKNVEGKLPTNLPCNQGNITITAPDALPAGRIARMTSSIFTPLASSCRNPFHSILL